MSRFLFATMSIPGHVAPLAPVARRLVARGHSVVWYTSGHFRDQVEATGASFRPLVSTLDYGDSAYDVHFPQRARLSGLRQVVFDFEHLFVGAVEGYVDDLRSIVADFHPDALVTDPVVAAGWILEEVDGLPCATINVSVLGLPSRNTAPFGLGLRPTRGGLGQVRNRVLLWVTDHVVFRRVNHAYRLLARRRGWPVAAFRPRTGRFLYLQPSIPELEYARDDLPAQVHFIGALLAERRLDVEEPDWWDDVVAARAQGRPVVLLTQGTIATNQAELVEPTLEALAAEPVLVVAAGVDPQRLAALPANTRATRYVDFMALMPLVDVFVTNGGFGGVMIALANGVPVLCAGTTEDKAEVAARVAHAGVGINLMTNRPSPQRVREAVQSLLAETGYRDRARTIRAILAVADAADTAADLLEELARTGQPVLSR